jgi:protein-tyrosine phosphatase
MNHLIAREGLSDRIICDSAGTSSYHIGSSPDRRMQAAAQKRGIVLRGQARQFAREDFEAFDLILAMDRENYRDLLFFDPAGKHQSQVRLMCEFATRHPDQEVPDPYYGGKDGFDYVINLLLDACEGLLQHILESEEFAAKAAG